MQLEFKRWPRNGAFLWSAGRQVQYLTWRKGLASWPPMNTETTRFSFLVLAVASNLPPWAHTTSRHVRSGTARQGKASARRPSVSVVWRQSRGRPWTAAGGSERPRSEVPCVVSGARVVGWVALRTHPSIITDWRRHKDETTHSQVGRAMCVRAGYFEFSTGACR
jgi:hypothetical protein